VPRRRAESASPGGISVFWVAVAVSAVALAAGLFSAHSRGTDVAAAVRIDAGVSATPYGSATPTGFLGLSLEFSAVERYAGTDPAALNPVFLALVRNLDPDRSPVLRIGGDSADWTWWPVPGVARPRGVTFALDDRWAAVTEALASALHAHLILGLNLEAGSPTVANFEANALLRAIPASTITAFQLGNEPELYASFPWYWASAGHGVTGRRAPYSFADFQADFTRVAAQLPPHALAGPTVGGPGWMPHLGGFLRAEPAVRVATVHRYPLQLCHTARDSDRFPSVDNLLSASASTQFADSFVAPVRTAHAHGVPLRIDELNTVACGADRAVSETFASALWALDTLFALRRVGVDGVQMHTFPGAGYELFPMRRGRQWSASVQPEYYGLMMFAAAAPPGSRLLRVTAPSLDGLSLWATAGPDHEVRVVLINKSTTTTVTTRLRVPAARGAGTLVRLTGMSPGSARGVALGGQSFGQSTTTGRLPAPRATPVAPVAGRYVVTVPPASAALLALRAG
jgi:hypothetical protein